MFRLLSRPDIKSLRDFTTSIYLGSQNHHHW